jgi:hypothetical protein
MDQKKRLEKATKDLDALLENHFDSLTPAERKAKSAAFHQAVAKIGTRAKSSGPLTAQGNRRAARRRA